MIGLTLSPEAIAAVAVVTALGAYVQTVTGFAMGLIAVGASTALDVVSVAAIAGAMTLLGVVNTGTALTGRTRLIDRRLTVLILAAAGLMTLRPTPRGAPAGPLGALTVGAIGGIFGGLFATGGPPIVYHLYREPLAVAYVRATLLAVFFVTALGRLAVIAARGEITADILVLSAIALPAVLGATWLGRRFPPPLSDHQQRRAAFALLAALGASLLVV